MSSKIRSSSMGAMPRPKKHFTSRAESVVAATLDVRCACQFFQSESLLPERVNPVGSRPSSRQDCSRPISTDFTNHVFEPDYLDPMSPSNLNYTNADHQSLEDKIPNGNGIASSNSMRKDLNGVDSIERKGYQNSMDTLRQKDPSQSVLLRRRSESTQRNLENIGQQRDPSTSSILRRRLSEKSINYIQQMDPSKSSLLRKRMDSQGSLQPQSSIEEPLAKEPKMQEPSPVQESTRTSQPPTNAERFMLSKSTFQTKPSVDKSDLYRETMAFPESERDEEPKHKIIDVGIIDLMTLGTSFIQKGVIKGKKKSMKDNENVDETASDNDGDEGSQEFSASTTNNQPTFTSPTSSALVHIGQNIYIEEPGDNTQQSVMPTKIERLSRRDYPDKKTDDVETNRDQNDTNLVADDYGSVENVSTTLLPRDLREQSTFTVDNQNMEPEKSITPKESSFLQKRYTQEPSDAPISSTTVIKQRDPSSSSMLRKRYGQSMDDNTDEMSSILDKIQNVDEPVSSSMELIEKKAVDIESDNEAVDSHPDSPIETTSKHLLSTTAEFRNKMDWIERTYNTR